MGDHSSSFGSSFGDITGALGDIFGSSESSSESGSSTLTGSRKGTKRLKIDQIAINKIIEDILGSNEGLAAIFSQEQGAGLFNSSVGKKGVEDLLAKVAGEIAKLTAVEEITDDIDQTTIFEKQSESSSGGLLDAIF